jgi:NAD(P)H dehydrogenase (quinone)
MSIAITGSTGKLGRLVIEGLKRKGTLDLIALARTASKAADLGVPARIADYGKPETLGPALAGVETLLLISGSELGQRFVQHRNVITAAKQAGVKRIVYTSLLHADTSPLSLADEHRRTEAELRASSVPHTILRNGWYTENYTAALGGALAAGALLGSAGEGRISSAARADFADAAVAVLTGDGHGGRVYELAGDEPYTLSDLAAELSHQTGKVIPYHYLPEADFAAALLRIGLPEGLAKAFASWDAAASRGALFDDSRRLSKLIGRPTTSLAQSVAAALAARA